MFPNILKIEKYKEKDLKVGILDKEQGLIVRAICCIIIILVHVPQKHGNTLQQAIAHFGYIAVSIFFMLSAYGLRYSIEHKPNYIKNFWKNRILVLLIPFWLVNILTVCITPRQTFLDNILMIIGAESISFITILLCYYMIFWLIHRLIKSNKICDCLLGGIIILYSFIGKMFKWPTGWFVESMGLFYGIAIYYLEPKLRHINQLKQIFLIGIVSVVLGITYMKYKEVYLIGTWGLKILLSISVILFVIGILNQIHFESTILKYIGNISYEIYLIHTKLIYWMKQLQVPSIIWIALLIFLSILLGAGIYYIDQKIIKRIKEKSNKCCHT